MFKSDLVVGVVVSMCIAEVPEDDELQGHQNDLQKLNHQLPRSLNGEKQNRFFFNFGISAEFIK